jgi:ABC-type glycerol-3-phosphate transport system permease component
MLMPCLYLVCSALKTRATFFSLLFLPPGHGFLGIDWRGLTLEHLYVLFTDPSLGFGRAVVNSVFYASGFSVLSMLCAAMGGYALAKFMFRANGLLTALVLASLIIPGPLLLALGYQLIYRFGVLDSFMGLIPPGIAPAFGGFLCRQTLLHTVYGLLMAGTVVSIASIMGLFLLLQKDCIAGLTSGAVKG